MALFCGWLGPGHFMWGWLDRWGVGKPAMLMLPCAANLAGAAIFAHLGRTEFADHAPRWLVRMLLALAFLYGTVASIAAVADGGWGRNARLTGQNGTVVFIFAAASVAVAAATLRAKRDVFPMALVIGSWIAVSTALIITHMRFEDLGAFFMVALWLIGTSSAAGFALMRWVREWRIDEDAPEAAA